MSGSVECLVCLVIEESGPTSGSDRIPCPSALNVAVTGGTGPPLDHWDVMRGAIPISTVTVCSIRDAASYNGHQLKI